MSAHTPGPWRVETGTTLVWGNCELAEDGTPSRLGYPVADMQQRRPWSRSGEPTPEIIDANARLIAAAPELLAALQGVLRVADRKTDEFDAARAAITTATGGAA